MSNAKHARTPLPSGYHPVPFTGTSTSDLQSEYQSVIGSLLYLMLGTRPDICYAVTTMAKYASNPSQEHLQKSLHILKYLAGTPDYALVYTRQGGEGLFGYSDSDYAGDPTSRKSTSGYLFKLARASISWRTHTQKVIATSSTMAEYISLSEASKQAKWYHTMFKELGIPISTIPIHGDLYG